MKLVHICEVCGREDLLTPEEAFREGWDYPPRLGAFGIVSPRTCAGCRIDKTAWWALCIENKTWKDLTPRQQEAVARIMSEPRSIIPSRADPLEATRLAEECMEESRRWNPEGCCEQIGFETGKRV